MLKRIIFIIVIITLIFSAGSLMANWSPPPSGIPQDTVVEVPVHTGGATQIKKGILGALELVTNQFNADAYCDKQGDNCWAPVAIPTCTNDGDRLVWNASSNSWDCG